MKSHSPNTKTQNPKKSIKSKGVETQATKQKSASLNTGPGKHAEEPSKSEEKTGAGRIWEREEEQM